MLRQFVFKNINLENGDGNKLLKYKYKNRN
jgi:hypothetical protein